MQKWEYIFVLVKRHADKNDWEPIAADVWINGAHQEEWRGKAIWDLVNLLGSDGWEMVMMEPLGGAFVFKRPRQS